MRLQADQGFCVCVSDLWRPPLCFGCAICSVPLIVFYVTAQIPAGAGTLQTEALSGGADARDPEDQPRLHLRQRCGAPSHVSCHACCMTSHSSAPCSSLVSTSCLMALPPPVTPVPHPNPLCLIWRAQAASGWPWSTCRAARPGFKTQHSDFLHGSTDFPRWAAAEEPYSLHKSHDRRVGCWLLHPLK
jgi:hypothetical protein